MTSPFDDLQNYRPGTQGLYSKTVSTASVAMSTLSADYYYQTIATVDVFWSVASTATVTSTAGEFLPSYDWSPPFKARSGDKPHAKVVGTTAGRMYVRKLGQA